MVYIKNLILLSFLVIALAGCKSLFGWSGWNFWSSASNVGLEFVTDDDSVFDLFQDDFGTGAQYDDRFTDDNNGSTNANDPAVTSPNPPVSTAVDPAYDEIAKMTQDELNALGLFKIPVLLISGSEIPFPAKQFGALKNKDKCDHLHYHGTSGWSLDLKNIPEPGNACGFDNNVTQRTVTGQQMIDWFHNRPRNF